MITIDDVNASSQSKIMTGKFSEYESMQKNDVNGFYSASRADQALLAFSIGYHNGVKLDVYAGKSFVNVTSIKPEIREELLKLVLYRHEDEIESVGDFWKIVESYAEYGITQLSENIAKNNGIILFDQILGISGEETISDSTTNGEETID